MSLTAKDVEAIMGLLEASRFDHLKLEMDGLKLELSRVGAAVRPTAAPVPMLQETPPDPAPAPAIAPGASAVVREGLVEVKSPLLGIFYRAPKPGEPAFVEVGDKVGEETIIGIVEVMKLMNSARAGVSGEVVEILARNGELIEHGEVLMLVRPASA
jgi:acetyl-CoA carboxylase biotin carboxyl carrier protein